MDFQLWNRSTALKGNLIITSLTSAWYVL